MSSGPRTTRSRRTAALFVSGTTLMAGAIVGLAPGAAVASSHREAPLIAGDPLGDNTDTYMFVSPDDPNSVTLIANWIGLQEPNGGPTFYPWGTGAQGYFYDIKIDNDGDAVSDITYRWTFTTDDRSVGAIPNDPMNPATIKDDTFLYANGEVTSLDDENLKFRQTYDISVSTDNGATFPTKILENAPVAPSNIGPVAMPNYDTDLFQAAVTPITAEVPAKGGLSYAGQADDPFFLDLRVFDLLYGAVDGAPTETGEDTLDGYNVNTVALKLPKTALALANDPAGNPVIGMWSTTARQSVNLADRTLTPGEVQVSRLGHPLINEVIIPTSLKDTFNSLPPSADATIPVVVDRVLDPEVPRLVELLYGAKAPATPRTDLAEIFLTGVTTALDNTGLYGGTLGQKNADGTPNDEAPIGLDLNSQALNAGYVDGTFKPSEMLRLNMGINGPTSLNENGTPGPALPEASSLGVVGGDIQGFPNGRRLADDVTDIELLTLGGFFLGDEQNAQANLLAAVGGDGVGANDRAFSDTFPYIASPNNESVNTGRSGDGGGAPTPQPTQPSNPAQPTMPPANNSSGIKTPVGGVETGAGSELTASSAVPMVSGAIALLLLGAGGASLYQGRRRKLRAEAPTSE